MRAITGGTLFQMQQNGVLSTYNGIHQGSGIFMEYKFALSIKPQEWGKVHQVLLAGNSPDGLQEKLILNIIKGEFNLQALFT